MIPSDSSRNTQSPTNGCTKSSLKVLMVFFTASVRYMHGRWSLQHAATSPPSTPSQKEEAALRISLEPPGLCRIYTRRWLVNWSWRLTLFPHSLTDCNISVADCVHRCEARHCPDGYLFTLYFGPAKLVISHRMHATEHRLRHKSLAESQPQDNSETQISHGRSRNIPELGTIDQMNCENEQETQNNDQHGGGTQYPTAICNLGSSWIVR